MASIQQSFNQMLSSAQLATGLYAHTPMGKQKAEIFNLERNIKTYNKAIESGTASSTEYEKRSAAAQKLYELDPSEERLDIEQQYTGEREKLFPSKPIQEKENKIVNAINSLVSRLEERTDQKQGLKERVQLLDQYEQIIGGNNDGSKEK